MKKIHFLFFLISFLFIYGKSIGQDYRVFEWGVSHLYETTDSIKGMRVDSSNVNGSDSIFYNYFVLDENVDSAGCMNSFAPSWFGRSIVIPSDSICFIVNNNNDSLLIRPLDNLGSSWQMYSGGITHRITATISNVSQQSLNGISDTIKEITLNEFYNNQPFNGILNHWKLKLSKHHGFIETLSFLRFPDDSTKYTLNDNLFLTDSTVYNYDVGDTLQYTYYVMPQYFGANPPPVYQNTRTIAILSKTVSANTYSYNIWEQLNAGYIYYDSLHLPHASISITTQMSSFSYSDLNTRIFSSMPDEIFSDPIYGLGRYSMNKNMSWPNCNAITATYRTADLYFDSSLNCIPARFEADLNTLEYAIGLGCTNTTQHIYHQNGTSNIYYLSGFHKGSSNCGNIYIYNGIEEEESKGLINIYPNPLRADEKLHIDHQSKIKSIEIVDLAGRIVYQNFDTGNNSIIDLSFLAEGVYLCRIKQSEGMISTMKLIRN